MSANLVSSRSGPKDQRCGRLVSRLARAILPLRRLEDCRRGTGRLDTRFLDAFSGGTRASWRVCVLKPPFRIQSQADFPRSAPLSNWYRLRPAQSRAIADSTSIIARLTSCTRQSISTAISWHLLFAPLTVDLFFCTDFITVQTY